MSAKERCKEAALEMLAGVFRPQMAESIATSLTQCIAWPPLEFGAKKIEMGKKIAAAGREVLQTLAQKMSVNFESCEDQRARDYFRLALDGKLLDDENGDWKVGHMFFEGIICPLAQSTPA